MSLSSVHVVQQRQLRGGVEITEIMTSENGRPINVEGSRNNELEDQTLDTSLACMHDTAVKCNIAKDTNIKSGTVGDGPKSKSLICTILGYRK